jgi:hypothetical protein
VCVRKQAHNAPCELRIGNGASCCTSSLSRRHRVSLPLRWCLLPRSFKPAVDMAAMAAAALRMPPTVITTAGIFTPAARAFMAAHIPVGAINATGDSADAGQLSRA